MIHRDDRDTIAVIRLAHGKVSALDLAFCEELTSELERVRIEPAVGLVLTGTGGTFSAGVDLFKVLDGGERYLTAFLPVLDRLFRTLLTFPRPVVAAVNGHAIAGGCIMASACDYRVMASGTARIGAPELLVGVPFPSLPLEILLSRVDVRSARRAVFLAENALPDDALRMGLVDAVADPADLLAHACEMAARLAAIPSTSFALTKEAFWRPVLDRVDARADLDERVLAAWMSAEVQSAIREYLDRTVRKAPGPAA